MLNVFTCIINFTHSTLRTKPSMKNVSSCKASVLKRKGESESTKIMFKNCFGEQHNTRFHHHCSRKTAKNVHKHTHMYAKATASRRIPDAMTRQQVMVTT